MKAVISILVVVVLIGCQEPEDSPIAGMTDDLFTILPTEISGINFQNSVEDTKDFNILNYRNFYNGGGVAIGDIDNDGLADIYFSANQNGNVLYRNEGNLKFNNVTETAGVEGQQAWSTGVSMVDINADGWLDIYVCNSGDLAGDSRENELFINQKDGSFTEEASRYGLNNKGYSTHASFFDYDQDGDLDCYLLNNSFKSPDRIDLYSRSRTEVDIEGGDKLYRNDGGYFTDVTLEAGIYTSDIGFGLGVSVSDVNGDMLPDIYVSNDFWERDYFYRNIGKGKFVEEAEQRFTHTSLNSMGTDIADLNNDGKPEIMTTDMLPADNYRRKTMTQFEPFRQAVNKHNAGYHHQLLQNTLQVNMGEGDFQELANLAGVAATDWSWGTLLFDINNDGQKDIFVSNGIHKDITDFDFVDFISDRDNVDRIVKESGRADFRDYLPYIPSTPLVNNVFISETGLHFTDYSSSIKNGAPSFSNGSAYGDLDNDGDLDLVVNNLNMEAAIYKNNSSNNFLSMKLKGPASNPFGIGAKVITRYGDEMQEYQNFNSRGFQSSVEPGIVIGLGNTKIIDELQIIWPDLNTQVLSNISVNQVISVKYEDANSKWTKSKKSDSPLFSENTHPSLMEKAVHKENDFNDYDYEVLLPYMLSRKGPKVLSGDLNSDQLDDFILLGAADQETNVFIQQSDGSFEAPFQQSVYFDLAQEATTGILFDYDSDGALDLLLGHGGNEIQKGKSNFGLRIYRNDGSGQFLNIIELPPPAGGNISCIEGSDVDRDGDMDLFIGASCVPGNYGLIPSSFFIKNEGKKGWASSTSEDIGRLGMVSDAKWSDIDNDGDKDLVVVGEWMAITIFINEDGNLRKDRTIDNSEGLWQTIEVADLDNDGDEDFIIGNWGTNSYFKASNNHPMSMYVKDFDENGKSEFIIEQYDPMSKAYYPIASKMDITAQIPAIKSKALRYDDFAKMGYNSLLTSNQRSKAREYQIRTLNSSILWNEEDGFRLESLPIDAQTSPIFAFLTEDVNKDGFVDIILVGNDHSVKPEYGRQDASIGLVLLNKSDQKFEALHNSGFKVKGESRDIVKLKTQKSALFMVARNDDSVVSFELSNDN